MSGRYEFTLKTFTPFGRNPCHFTEEDIRELNADIQAGRTTKHEKYAQLIDLKCAISKLEGKISARREVLRRRMEQRRAAGDNKSGEEDVREDARMEEMASVVGQFEIAADNVRLWYGDETPRKLWGMFESVRYRVNVLLM